MRAELRSSWRAVVAVSLVLAFGGGVALTAAAGARRTQTAMRRFVEYNRPEDATVFFSTTPQIGFRVLSLPQVARWMQLPYLFVSTDPSKLDSRTAVFGAAGADALQSIERPMIVRGRRWRPGRADEVMVNEREASALHLHVGSSFTLYAFLLRQAFAAGGTDLFATMRPEGPRYSVRVVGITREPTDIAVVPHSGDVSYGESGTVYASPAFVSRLARALGTSANALPGSEIVRVQLRRGERDLPSFTEAADTIARNRIQILPGSDNAQAATAVQHGIGVEVIAMWLFAVVSAITTLLVVSLLITRMLRTDSREYRRLWELGMSRRQLRAVVVFRPLLIAALGGLLAVGVAIAASPVTPIGLARQAEIHRGYAVNVAVLAGSLGVIIVVLVAIAIGSALTVRFSDATRSTRRSPTRRRFTEKIATAGLGPSMRLGFGSAFSDDSIGASSRRIAIAVIMIATTGLVAAATFGASLDGLAASPRQQGWNFDVAVGNPNGQTDQEAHGATLLGRDPYVAAFSAIASPPDTPSINGINVGLVGIDARRGDLEPVMLDGQPPRSPDEIVLASATMRRLRVRIGDSVAVVAGTKRAKLRITGRMLQLSAGDVFSGRLDEGGGVTLQGLRRLEPAAIVTMFVVDYKRGSDPHAALIRLQRDFGSTVLQRIPARDVENLVRVNTIPWLLAALLAIVAAATLVQVLTGSVFRREHELAILKALGFERSQLAASVLWQTWALALIGIALGVAVGMVVGRAAWTAVADNIGSVQPALVPVGNVALVIAMSAATVTAIALAPAWLARRVARRPRSEASKHGGVGGMVVRFEECVVINRPVEEVFSFVSDLENDPPWTSAAEVRRLSPGPIGVGTTFCQRARFIGRNFQLTLEVIGYEENHSITVKASTRALSLEGCRIVDPVGDSAARVTASGGGQARGLLRFMEPLFAKTGAHQLRGQLERLKRLLEPPT